MWGKTYFFYKGEKMSVGKYYSNLLPIMENTPNAYTVLKEGICILSNNRPYGYAIVFSSFAIDLFIDVSETEDEIGRASCRERV